MNTKERKGKGNSSSGIRLPNDTDHRTNDKAKERIYVNSFENVKTRSVNLMNLCGNNSYRRHS